VRVAREIVTARFAPCRFPVWKAHPVGHGNSALPEPLPSSPRYCAAVIDTLLTGRLARRQGLHDLRWYCRSPSDNDPDTGRKAAHDGWAG
jgi:hypothetical protein